jgi:hypothetical protein
MNELKFFLLTGVSTQNFNTVDFVKFLEKNQKLHIEGEGLVEGDIMQNHEQKEKVKKKKWKNKIRWAKQTSFLAPCPSILGQF